MPTILLTNHYEDRPLEIIKNAVPGYFELQILDSVNQQELEDKVADVDYLLVSGRLKISSKVLENGKKLKMIQRTGVGLDSLDLDTIKEKNIPLYVNKGINANSVAEHTLLLMLAALRNLIQIDKNTKNGIWKKQIQGVHTYELNGKTVGLIGMGAIGRRVAEILKGFHVNIMYYDVYRASTEVEQNLGMKYCELDELMAKSDIISLHCPLTKDTEYIINVPNINKMKDGVILINTARGRLIKEEALVEALKNGKLLYAGIDVYEKEPAVNSTLFELENVITTPHIGGVTYNSFSEMMNGAMRNIDAFENGELDKIEQYRYKF